MRTTDTSHKGLSAGGMILNRSNRHYHNTDEKEFKGKWEYKPSCNSKNWGLVRPTNVQTLNITINEYNKSPIEESKLSKMINDSIKNIAKIIENSSKERNESRNWSKVAKPRPKLSKQKDRVLKPPRHKKKTNSKTKKNKTVSIEENEEKKEHLPEIDFDVGRIDEIEINEFHTFMEVANKKLNLTEPNLNLKKRAKHKEKFNNNLANTVHKPRMAYSWDKECLKNILIKRIRDRLKREI